jgi:hypothetical protein
MTVDIREGIEFILSHSKRQFPRRIFTPKTKQMTVYNIDEMAMIFRLNDLLDCKISLYPSYSRVLDGHHPPDALFIDLDMNKYYKNGHPLVNPKLTVANRLRNTIKRINSYLGGEFHPSIISSGSGGYHIVQPLDAIDLKEFWYKDKLLFMGFGCNPNVQFLRFLEPLVCPWADSEHYSHVSMNNYLVRVPGSINSKVGEQVKIVQRWDGKRPEIKYVFGDFLAYLYDSQEQQQQKPMGSIGRWLEYCEKGALK